MKSQHCRPPLSFSSIQVSATYHRVQAFRFSGPKTEAFSLRQAMCLFPSLLFVIFPYAIASKRKIAKPPIQKSKQSQFWYFWKSVRILSPARISSQDGQHHPRPEHLRRRRRRLPLRPRPQEVLQAGGLPESGRGRAEELQLQADAERRVRVGVRVCRQERQGRAPPGMTFTKLDVSAVAQFSNLQVTLLC